MRTSYNGYDKHPYLEGKDVQDQLTKDNMNVFSKSYESIKNDHLFEYQKLYRLVELNFGERIDDMPTDERLIAFQTKQDDPYLYALLFHYGRYLLISSSRNCVLSANLQGIWNNELRAPFSCNYTTNINMQMNYWPLATTSPENTFIYEGNKCHIVKCSTMSLGIIREVFNNVIKCCALLSIDEQFFNEVQEYLTQLFPYQIGNHGQLLEWEEAYEEYEPHHRHISHLYPLYPGDEIHPNKTPELANACKVTLCDRTDVGTGWSLGWKINTLARLQDGDHALKLLKNDNHIVTCLTTRATKRLCQRT